jgi:hypothetical protein
MSRKQKPDLVKIAADLELVSARVDAVRRDVRHLVDDIGRLAELTVTYADTVSDRLAEMREARIRGLL